MPTLKTPNGVEQARREFRACGIVLPPVPADRADRFVRRGRLCYSTRPVTIRPYNFHEHVECTLRPRVRDFLLVAHDGHGINSYAVHLYLVLRPVRLLLQLAWGGVYMGPDATERVNKCLRETRALIRLAERRGVALTVVASDFYASWWSCSGSEPIQTPALHALEVIEQARRWLERKKPAASQRPKGRLRSRWNA
jgi:hypothetical protein